MTDRAENGENLGFDFITDAAFRTSLRSDYRELLRCLETSAWKAVHVLAGSVVEAILCDHLIASGYAKRTGRDPLTMDLGGIIAVCKSEKVITDRTADLSSVVRSYRNLIHPGRMIRLNEKVDQKTAAVSKALVDIVAEEVATAKAGSYGFTAEQIANKIEKDSSTLSVITHFLKETNEIERERLAKDVIPERYFLARNNGFDYTSMEDYRKCHRETFYTLSDEGKTKVSKQFIKILKEQPGDYVLEYETAFFTARDMKYLPPNDAALAKAHILSRLAKEQTEVLLDVLEGLGSFLTPAESSEVVDAYVRMITFGKDQGIKLKARDVLNLLYYDADEQIRKTIEGRIDQWIPFLEKKEHTLAKTILEEIKAEWTIPF